MHGLKSEHRVYDTSTVLLLQDACRMATAHSCSSALRHALPLWLPYTSHGLSGRLALVQ